MKTDVILHGHWTEIVQGKIKKIEKCDSEKQKCSRTDLNCWGTENRQNQFVLCVCMHLKFKEM